MSGNIVSLQRRRLERLPEIIRPFRRWSEAMPHVDLAEAVERVAWAEYTNAVEDHGKDSEAARAAYEAYTDAFLPRVVATSRAMMTPAPDAKALRWKQICREMAGGSTFWDEAIEADCSRLRGK